MTKARDLADLISTGNPLADGAIAASEVSGLATVATSGAYSDVTGTPSLAAVATSGAVADVTGAAPLASPTFTGDVTLPDKIVHTGDTNTAIRFPAADTVAFETGGSERFRFGSAGQLGIAGANYGTSGQVLQSGGASGAASWADAGGGAYEVVSDAAYTSGASTIDFTVEPDYFYTLEFMGVGITAGGAELQIKVSTDAFSSTENIQWFVLRTDIWSATQAHTKYASSANYFAQTYGRLSYGNIADSGDPQSVHGQMHFAQKTGDYWTYYGDMHQPTNVSHPSNYPQRAAFTGRAYNTASVNRLRIYGNSGNIVATRMRLLRRS